jgi:Protein of unknown function (DUF3108)
MKHLTVRILAVCFALAATLLSASLVAEHPAGLPFSPGETLTYNVTWSVLPAGRVTATLIRSPKNPGGEFEVKTTAESTGLVSVLYNVDDEFHSFFSPNTLCSQSISKEINEGRRHRETHIRFDYLRKLAILDEHDPTKPKAAPKRDEKEIPACVEDVVSAFYFLRSRPLEVGKEIQLAVNDGSKTADVVVEVQKREQIQTGVGTREAVRVEPKIFGALYPRKGRMLIWFSDDPQRLPLRIRMMISLGDITGTLASVTSSAEKRGPASTTGRRDPQP